MRDVPEGIGKHDGQKPPTASRPASSPHRRKNGYRDEGQIEDYPSPQEAPGHRQSEIQPVPSESDQLRVGLVGNGHALQQVEAAIDALPEAQKL